MIYKHTAVNASWNNKTSITAGLAGKHIFWLQMQMVVRAQSNEMGIFGSTAFVILLNVVPVIVMGAQLPVHIMVCFRQPISSNSHANAQITFILQVLITNKLMIQF